MSLCGSHRLSYEEAWLSDYLGLHYVNRLVSYLATITYMFMHTRIPSCVFSNMFAVLCLDGHWNTYEV